MKKKVGHLKVSGGKGTKVRTHGVRVSDWISIVNYISFLNDKGIIDPGSEILDRINKLQPYANLSICETRLWKFY